MIWIASLHLPAILYKYKICTLSDAEEKHDNVAQDTIFFFPDASFLFRIEPGSGSELLKSHPDIRDPSFCHVPGKQRIQ